MSTVANYTFDTDAEGFSAGSRTASEGADFDTGYLTVPTNTTASKSHTAISSGVFRVDFHFRVDDTGTAADATKTDFFYLLPTSGAVSSANSITAIAISRSTSQGASTELVSLQRRDSSAFVEFVRPYRIGWFKISIVADFTAKTFDLYVNDALWEKGVAWANNSAADFSRVVVLTGSASPGIIIDEILIQDAWTLPTESVLVDHTFVSGSGEIEDSTPTTNTRSINGQNWKIPDDTANFGGFTLGANGAAPDSSKECFAYMRCVAEGIVEMEFKSSVAGTIYFGLLVRGWEGPTQGGAVNFRWYGGASNTLNLIIPDSTSVNQTAQTASLTPSANTTYTLKVEMRGRVYICSYKAAAMDSGSYTVAYTHTVTDSATGGRGVLSEEHCGPIVATTLGATDNYIRRFRFTGRVPTGEATPTIGSYQTNLCRGSVRELYHSSSGGATKNLFLSKGIQYGHRSRADMGNYNCAQQTIYNGTHVKAYRQRGQNTTEYQVLGESDCYITFFRNRIWVSDRTTAGGNSENLAPDFDLHKIHFNGSYKALGPTGTTISDLTDTAYHDWRTDLDNKDLPLCVQRLTGFGSGNQVRLTSVIRNNQNWGATGGSNDLTHKMKGNCDPISHAVGRLNAEITHGTAYECGRAYLVECANGLALDDDTLIDFRDDVNTPATLSATVGSLKTNASGDIDTDGFNERHGWYEWTCSGGLASFTIPVTSGSPRYYPAIRLNSWTNTNTSVSIDGTPGVSGMDYVIDDLGGSVGLLQILSVRSANTDIVVSAPVNASRLLLLGVG